MIDIIVTIYVTFRYVHVAQESLPAPHNISSLQNQINMSQVRPKFNSRMAKFWHQINQPLHRLLAQMHLRAPLPWPPNIIAESSLLAYLSWS